MDSHAEILRSPHLPDWTFRRDGAICELTGLHDQLSTADVINLVADHLTAILPEDLFFILRSRGYIGGARPGFSSYPDNVTVALKSFLAPWVPVSTLQDLAAVTVSTGSADFYDFKFGIYFAPHAPSHYAGISTIPISHSGYPLPVWHPFYFSAM